MASHQKQCVSIEYQNSSMVKKKQLYDFVRSKGSDDDLARYSECFEANGFLKPVEGLKWIHQQNITGKNIIYFAIEKSTGKIAAIQAWVPFHLKLNNDLTFGAQAIDALVDSNHRSKGLFSVLTAKLIEAAKTNHFELEYGFPNQNSAPSFFGKIGWTNFGEVPFLIKPLGISYIINKLLKLTKSPAAEINCALESPDEMIINKNSIIKQITVFDKIYDELWLDVAPHIKVGVNRDAHYLNWRYVSKPGELYYKYGYYENEKLKAVAVLTLKNKHGGKIAYLMELIVRSGDEKKGARLLKFCSAVLKQNKAELILAWCLSHSFNYVCYRKAGYYNFPEKLRPQKLYFGARAFNPVNKNFIDNIGNWYISYSDSDTV